MSAALGSHMSLRKQSAIRRYSDSRRSSSSSPSAIVKSAIRWRNMRKAQGTLRSTRIVSLIVEAIKSSFVGSHSLYILLARLADVFKSGLGQSLDITLVELIILMQ